MPSQPDRVENRPDRIRESPDPTEPVCIEDSVTVSVRRTGHRIDVPFRYRIEGPSGAPVVVVLGGLNGGRDIRRWWPHQAGDGRVLDPAGYRLAGIDWAVAPRHAPIRLSIRDQARGLRTVLEGQGIRDVHAVVGASFGGMVALALAEEGRLAIRHLVVISAADRSHPAATASRLLQRRIVDLAARAGRPDEGLALARGVAMLGYRTPALFGQRFDHADPATVLGEIGRYLAHVGQGFSRRFDPRRFRDLSRSLDEHRIVPGRVTCATTLLGVRSDTVVPIDQLRQLAGRIAGPARLIEIDSPCGHDAFLMEHDTFSDILDHVLEETNHAST